MQDFYSKTKIFFLKAKAKSKTVIQGQDQNLNFCPRRTLKTKDILQRLRTRLLETESVRSIW